MKKRILVVTSLILVAAFAVLSGFGIGALLGPDSEICAVQNQEAMLKTIYDEAVPLKAAKDVPIGTILDDHVPLAYSEYSDDAGVLLPGITRLSASLKTMPITVIEDEEVPL